MWMRPSSPSRTRTKAPKLTSFVTVPSITSPTLKSATVECHEAVDPAKVDEDTERGDAPHRAGDLLADLQTAEELVPLLAALLVQRNLLGENQPIGLAIDLEDLKPKLAADERHQLLGDFLGRIARLVVLWPSGEVDDLADRHETADAAVDDQATLVVVDHGGFDDHAPFQLLLHRAPLALEAGAPEREDNVAFRL